MPGGLSMSWTDLAAELGGQSADLNARLADNCLCPGALVRNAKRRGPMSCQYALIILRWIDRVPEDFLVGPTRGLDLRGRRCSARRADRSVGILDRPTSCR